MNEILKEYLESVEEDINNLTEPESFKTREEMGEMFRTFVGYDPTRYWDWELMHTQFDKLSGEDGYQCKYEDREPAIEAALDHYDAVKGNLMLQVAQKTIKDMYDKEVTADDLNLDLEYLLNNEIFGTGYNDGEDEDDEESLLDELEDDDEFEDDDDEYEITN